MVDSAILASIGQVLLMPTLVLCARYVCLCGRGGGVLCAGCV